MKTISVRLSDRDLRNLDLLSARYYGSDLVLCEDINLPLSPVIRASILLASEAICHDPDLDLHDPVFALPDGSGVAGSSR